MSFFKKKAPQPHSIEWLIVGLGNPGAQYNNTRHNIGFEVIDQLSEDYRIKLDKSRHQSRFGIGTIRDVGVVLAKPVTFMNLSGRAVVPLAKDNRLPPSNILVIADETDLPLGRIRLRAGGGAGGHNGHKSIIALLGTQEYPRLRLGIGRVDKSETVDHVLGKFEFDELASAREMVQSAVKAVLSIVENGVERSIPIVNAGPEGERRPHKAGPSDDGNAES